jgi:hypothetical protein
MVKAEVANTNNLRDIEYYKEKCKDREGQIKTIKAEIQDLSDELRISEIKKNMKCKFEITSKVIVKYEPEDEIRKYFLPFSKIIGRPMNIYIGSKN